MTDCPHVNVATVPCEKCGTYRRGCPQCQVCHECLPRPTPVPVAARTDDASSHPLGPPNPFAAPHTDEATAAREDAELEEREPMSGMKLS